MIATLRFRALSLANRERVKQRLCGMLVRAISCIDDEAFVILKACGEHPGEMADDDGIGNHGISVLPCRQCFTFGNAASTGSVNDVGRDNLQFRTTSFARGSLEERLMTDFPRNVGTFF
jgi:hypothetical protein